MYYLSTQLLLYDQDISSIIVEYTRTLGIIYIYIQPGINIDTEQ